jgi:hypothetical protein
MTNEEWDRRIRQLLENSERHDREIAETRALQAKNDRQIEILLEFQSENDRLIRKTAETADKNVEAVKDLIVISRSAIDWQQQIDNKLDRIAADIKRIADTFERWLGNQDRGNGSA